MKITKDFVQELEKAANIDLEVFESSNHVRVSHVIDGKEELIGRVGRYEFKINPFESCMKVIHPYLKQNTDREYALKPVPRILNWSKTGIFICANQMAVLLDDISAIDIGEGEVLLKGGQRFQLTDADILAEAWQVWRRK